MNREEFFKRIKNIQEAGGHVIGFGEQPEDGLYRLKYDPNTRQFQNHRKDVVSIFGKDKEFRSSFIHDYYPKNRCGDLVDDNIQKVRRLNIQFQRWWKFILCCFLNGGCN